MADRHVPGLPITHLKMERLEDRTTPAIVPGYPYADGRILIGLTPGVEGSALSYVNGSSLVASTQHIGFGVYKVNLRAGVTVPQAVSALEGRNGVRYAQPDYAGRYLFTPNDPQYTEQWGLNNTGQQAGVPGADVSAEAAWDVSVGTRQTIVAVVDSGTDFTHEDIVDNLWSNPGEIPGNSIDDDGNGFIDDTMGWNFGENNNQPVDTVDHGSHVGGIIGARGNNGIGISGVNQNTQLMILRLGDIPFESNAIAATAYAVANGAKISNNSYGGYPATDAFRAALTGARNAGLIFVAAAGNNASDNDVIPYYPTNYSLEFDNVVSVAATDRNDNIANFSQWGRNSVTVGAPGVDILSVRPNNSYQLLSGTSMASPMVAGALSLAWDIAPTATYQEIIQAMKDSVDLVPDLIGRTVTGGRINIENMISQFGTDSYATGAGAGGGPVVNVYRGASGRPVTAFFAYDPSFTGGVRVASADVNGDGITDIIAVPGQGGGPNVRVFDGKTFQIVYDFQAFEPEFTGGLFVAARDMDNDGWAEIVVSADRGGGPRVTVFKPNPLKDGVIETLANFFAYDTGFSGGVRIALGDTDGDGKADLITAPGFGGGPNVRVYSGAELALGAAVMTVDAMAGNVNNRNGLFVAADDLTGDGIADIIVGSGAGTPVVRIYNGVTFDLYRQFTASGGPIPGLVLDQDTNLDGTSIDPGFPDSLIPPAVPPKQLPLTAKGETPLSLNGYQYGVRVATHDVNRDGVADLILGAGPTDQPKVSLVNGSTFGQIRNFQAYANFFYGGVFVGGAGVVAS